jgi:AmiR/NasT family two-component response regulator
MVQLGTDAEGAFAALRARAYQEGRSLAEVAADVLDRRVRMTDEEV